MIHRKVCPICGIEFETRLSKAVYCGELCACKARSIKSLKYAKRANHDPKPCAECGGEFIPKSKLSRFCCEDCKKIYTSKKNKTGFSPKACKYCGKEFIPNSNYAKYCSDECRKGGRREAYKKKVAALEGNLCTEGTKKSENKSPAQRRWEKMTWKEISAECARLHISYGQAQQLYYSGTLPLDFGLKNKMSQKGDCPQNGTF